MGFFRRDDKDDDERAAVAAPVEPPHPALHSLQAFESASLRDLATAVLVAGLTGYEAGESVYEYDIQQRVEVFLKQGIPEDADKVLREAGLSLMLDEALQVLERSLLVRLHHIGNQRPHVAPTRRGARALASGDPAAWIDVPADPA